MTFVTVSEMPRLKLAFEANNAGLSPTENSFFTAGYNLIYSTKSSSATVKKRKENENSENDQPT